MLNKLEDAITESKAEIALNDVYQRLKQNPDFKKIIGELYLRDLAIALVRERGQPGIDAETAASVDLDIIAVGRLDYFLRTFEHNAEIARSTIVLANEQIVDLHTDSEGEE